MLQVTSAQQESRNPGEMKAKVAMVDNLVNMFIQTNAMRAKKKFTSNKSTDGNSVRLKTMGILEGLKEELGIKKPGPIRIKPSRDSKRILIEKSKKRPNNYRDRTNGLKPPIRLHRVKDPGIDIKEPVNLKAYDITLGPRERQPKIEVELEVTEKKSAPLILDRNPLLRILQPTGQDEKDKSSLTPPAYRQDPLLRQLLRHPEVFKENFLELPSRKQDTLLKILRSEGGSGFDEDILAPPNARQNPLLRLLKPTGRDEKDKFHLTPPSQRQDPLLRQLVDSPADYREDFLSLPLRNQDDLVELLEKEVPQVISELAPLRLDRNPLLRLLQPNYRDKKEKHQLRVPSYRQDPLLRQLSSSPEDYREDFLSLPQEERRAVVEAMQEEGLAEEAVQVLARLLMPSLNDLFEMTDKEDMSEKIFDMLITDTSEAAESFSELFEFSSVQEKKETVEEIIEMVEKDPTAVTSAFSDLIFEKMKQQKLQMSMVEPQTLRNVFPTASTTTATTSETQRIKKVDPTTTTTTVREQTTKAILEQTTTVKESTPTASTTTTEKETTQRIMTVKPTPILNINKPSTSFTLHNPETTKQTVFLKADEDFLNGPQEDLERELAATKEKQSTLQLRVEGKELFTPEAGHPYRDPPSAAKGQLLRLWKDSPKDEADAQGPR